jgi:hypothetical protein
MTDRPDTSGAEHLEPRCGFVAIVGAPNAGKSTLLNRLTGAKLSIVTPKAQTTRFRVLGILMRGPSQILLVDTPGIRLLNGSWNTTCTRLRKLRSWLIAMLSMRLPSRKTSPSVGSTRRRMALPTVLLPQPLSPTRESVSPLAIANPTSSTACTVATWRFSSPPCTAKCFRSPVATSIGCAGPPRSRGSSRTPARAAVIC